MGSKFANMHVRTPDIDIVKKAINQYRLTNKNDIPKSFRGFKLPDELVRLTDLINNRYFVGCFDSGWVSILNMSYGFETINESAVDISKFIHHPILTISYFDDDIFIMSLVKNGNIITSHISGDGVNEYGYSEHLGDIDLFINELNIELSAEILKDTLTKDNIENKVHEVEQKLSLPLWVKADYLDEDEELSEVYKEI